MRPTSTLRLFGAFAMLCASGCTLNDPQASFDHNQPPTAHGQFDGRYAGSVVPQVDNDMRCGNPYGTVVMHVAGGEIWVHHRHSNSEISGGIGADGRFELHDFDNSHTIVGAITNNTLLATETANNTAPQSLSAIIVCTYTITATRR